MDGEGLFFGALLGAALVGLLCLVSSCGGDLKRDEIQADAIAFGHAYEKFDEDGAEFVWNATCAPDTTGCK